MVTRVGAPTLGGSGYVERRGESTVSKLGRLAQIGAGLSGMMARREQEANDTAYMEGLSTTYRALQDMDSDPAMAQLSLEEKQSKMRELVDGSSAKMGEMSPMHASELKLKGDTLIASLLADDVKLDQERQNAQILDTASRMVTESQAGIEQAVRQTFHASTAADGVASLGRIRSDLGLATKHATPLVREAVMRDANKAISRASVDEWLNVTATDPVAQVAAYEALRSNEDEVTLPDGTTYNISGMLTPTEIDERIKLHTHKMDEKYRLEKRARDMHDEARLRSEAKAVDMVKTGIFSGQMTANEARALKENPSTPTGVAEGIDDFLAKQAERGMAETRRGWAMVDRQWTEEGREWTRHGRGKTAVAAADKAIATSTGQQMMLDSYLREMQGAGSAAEVSATRSEVVNGTLHPTLIPQVLAAGRAQVEKLRNAERNGTSERVVSYAKDNKAWLTRGKDMVQGDVPGGVGDRIAEVEATPALKAKVDAEHAQLARLGEALLLETDGEAQAFLEAVMPLAYAESYERAMGGARPGTDAPWARLMGRLRHKETLDAIGAMDEKAWFGFLVASEVVDADQARWLRFRDDGAFDPDRSLLARHDEGVRTARAMYPVQTVNRYERNRARDAVNLQTLLKAGKTFLSKNVKTATDWSMEVAP